MELRLHEVRDRISQFAWAPTIFNLADPRTKAVPRATSNQMIDVGMAEDDEDADADSEAEALESANGAEIDLCLLFVSGAYGSKITVAPSLITELVDPTRLVGCAAGGIIGNGSRSDQRRSLHLIEYQSQGCKGEMHVGDVMQTLAVLPYVPRVDGCTVKEA